MYLQTHYSHHIDATLAIDELAQKLKPVNLKFLICYYTEEYDAPSVKQQLVKHFPTIPIQGCSSFEAVMTEVSYHIGPVIAVMGFYSTDHRDVFGSGLAHIADQSAKSDSVTLAQISQSTNQAIDLALQQANRIGEIPSLLILHATPGYEEQIIECIDNKFGTLVPLIGGSAADNQVAKRWSVFTEQDVSRFGITVSAIYSIENAFTNFSAGYLPTELSGIVTQCNGRELIEIDHCPAADVYDEWTGQLLSKSDNDGLLFNKTTEFPLGRKVDTIAGQQFFKLSHIIRQTQNKSIELFTNIDVGDHVYLMSGNKELLVNRAHRIALSGMQQKDDELNIVGGINIFCAGPLHYVNDAIYQINDQIKTTLRQPFICPFTFGEQGRFINGDNAHGNLMISSAFFHHKKQGS